MDETVLLPASPVVSAATRTVAMGAEAVRLGDWSLHTRRHCPECLADDARVAASMNLPPQWWTTSRGWWDVRSVDACPVHGVAMIDRCRACGDHLSWRRPILTCGCGAIVTAGGGIGVDAAGSAYLVGRLTSGSRAAVPLLDGMDFADAVRSTELLGAARSLASNERRGRRDDAAGRVAGFSVANAWPMAFEGILDALLASRTAASPDGLIGAYGWTYATLCGPDAPETLSRHVGPLLRRHAVAHGVIANDEDRLGAVVPPTVTITGAARRLGRSFASTRRLLEADGAIPRGSRRGVSFAIDPAALARAGREVTASGAGRLGVGRSQVRTLLADVRVAAALRTDRTSSGDLLKHVRRRARPGTVEGGVPLPVACRNMSVPLSAACLGVLDGTLAVTRCGPPAAGLAGLAVRQADLAGLRRVADLCPTEEVARLAGLHHEAARQLARLGAFGPLTDGRPGRAAVEAFLREHVTTRDLSGMWLMSANAVLAHLARSGVQSAFGPPEVRQRVFRRRDLPKAH